MDENPSQITLSRRIIPLLFAIAVMLALPFAILGYVARDIFPNLLPSERAGDRTAEAGLDGLEENPETDPLRMSLTKAVQEWQPELHLNHPGPDFTCIIEPESLLSLKNSLQIEAERNEVFLVELDPIADKEVLRLVVVGNNISRFIQYIMKNYETKSNDKNNLLTNDNQKIISFITK